MGLVRSVVSALVIAAALPALVAAQSGSSTITGIVKDSTGGAIPGAQVTVVNEETNVSVDSVTNQEGAYRVGALVPGTYRVEVVLSGFEPVTRRALGLQVVNLLLAMVIWWPFVRRYDRALRAKEQAG